MVGGRNIAIIPARGGSKRIEKKNIVPFCGKPMIAWTIEAALESGLFERVLVSTDDPEIAEVGRKFGASAPFLRKNYNDDISPVSLATIGTLQQLKDELGEEYDNVVQLMANCPLRNAGHITEAFNHCNERGANSQISCFKFGWMNAWWATALDENGRPKYLFPGALLTRSQDLGPLYCPTGAVWVARIPELMRQQTFHTPDEIYWPMPWEAAVDIDDHEDLRMAEVLFHMQEKQS
jgi:N-acylneuraminate cytidylyltransferase